MIVTDTDTLGTIGGGALEYQATAHARALLANGDRAEGWQRVPLGPSLGQCCGGVVELAFERVPSGASPAWLERLSALQARGRRGVLLSTRAAADTSAPFVHMVVDEQSVTGTLGDPALDERALAAARAMLEDAQSVAHRHFEGLTLELHGATGFAVYLFGAGHVGRALAPLLATLPCRLTWVDERAAQFPDPLPACVETRITRAPEAVVDSAPPGAWFLVMTHSHPLDLRLCERVMRREDFRYLGLIGSASKRRRFEKRLQSRGIPAHTTARLTCPVGLPGIDGKEPAVIAVAVAAQLLVMHAEPQIVQQAAPARR